jgi:hypothetical protein
VDDYFVGPVEAFSEQTGERFHAISLTHVIEHLPDPVGTLKILSGLLEPGGLIFVTAPSRPKNWSPEQGLGPWLNYSYLHVPAHITYFSETSLQMAAQKAGLRLSFWDGSHDNGQAFEAILSQDLDRPRLSLIRRLAARSIQLCLIPLIRAPFTGDRFPPISPASYTSMAIGS